MYYYEKPPLVFVHGLAEDHSIFNRQISFLQERNFVTYTYDLAGHGNTPLPKEKLTISRHADDLERLLDKEGIEIANIVGFSLGGTISLEFASKYPERIAKMCLINPGLYCKELMTWQVNLLEHCLKGLKWASKYDKKQRFNHIDLSQAPFSTAYYSFPYGLTRINLQGLYANVHAFMNYGVPEYLHEIGTETLILRAKSDELLKKELAYFLHGKLKNSELREMEGNHVLMLSNTEEVNRTLAEYFKMR